MSFDSSWQVVNSSKRPRTHSPNTINNTSKKTKEDTTINPFDILRIDDDENDADKPPSNVAPKPPPIIFPDVADINKMMKTIEQVIPSDDFYYKVAKNNEIRLMVKNVESYRKLMKCLESTDTKYHTYQLKQERSYRVVLKGLHYTTDINSIKAKITSLGHNVRNIRNATSRVNKKQLNMFFIDLDPAFNNKEIFTIKYINNAVVTFEPIKTFDDLVQCFRCQEFGHTQNYCKKPFRCVKCSLSHPTSDCTKSNDTPPKCVHCQQVHTANYKGCTIYQQILKNKGIKKVL